MLFFVQFVCGIRWILIFKETLSSIYGMPSPSAPEGEYFFRRAINVWKYLHNNCCQISLRLMDFLIGI